MKENSSEKSKSKNSENKNSEIKEDVLSDNFKKEIPTMSFESNDKGNMNNSSLNITNLFNQINIYKDKNQYEECIKLVESHIFEITEQYSKKSSEYYFLAREVADICDKIAIINFNEQNYDAGLTYLEKCISLYQNYKPILSICYNNLGHFYRKLNIFNKAFQLFDKAISIATEMGNKKEVAEIHFNYALTLVSINKLKLALEQSLIAVILFQEYLTDLNLCVQKNEKSGIVIEEFDDEKMSILEMLEYSYNLVAICKYRLGNILESLMYYELMSKIKDMLGSMKDDSEGKIKRKPNDSSMKSDGPTSSSSAYDLPKLSEETKLKMLKEALIKLANERKETDPLELMAQNYMKEQLASMTKIMDSKVHSTRRSEQVSFSQKEQISRFIMMCKKLKETNGK